MSELEYRELVALLDRARADVVAGNADHESHAYDYAALASARDVAVRLARWRAYDPKTVAVGYLAPLPPVTPESIRA